jgi:hypothetical protein
MPEPTARVVLEKPAPPPPHPPLPPEPGQGGQALFDMEKLFADMKDAEAAKPGDDPLHRWLTKKVKGDTSDAR